MKFPIAFRVFGAINLLGFLLLAFQTAFFFDKPYIGFWPVVLSGATALWFLITAFAWMFASNKSYTFLYLTVVIMSAMFISVISGILSTAKTGGRDGIIFMSIYGVIGLIYALFMVITLFFKPVKNWMEESPESRKKFDAMPTGALLVVLLASWITFYTLGNANKRILPIDESYTYDSPDSARFSVNLNYMVEFDKLSIAAGEGAPSMLRVAVQFADNYEANKATEFIRTDTFTLNKVDERYEVAFEAIRARRLVFTDLNPNRKPFSVGIVTVSRTVDYYNIEADYSQFVFNDGIEPPVPEGYDGDSEYYESEYYAANSYTEPTPNPDGETIPFSVDDQRSLIEQFLMVMSFNYNQDTRYDFNDNEVRSTIDGKDYGYYKQFSSLFKNHLGKTLNNFIIDRDGGLDDELSINEGIRTISGVNLYNPNGYEGSELPFGRLNPEFLTWASNNLVFANDEPLFNETISIQYIYDGTFRRTLWMLAASYEYLGDGETLKYETDLYWNAMQEEGFEGVSYLHKRYGQSDLSNTFFSKYYEQFPKNNDEYYYFNEPEALGFWMRRHLDGSREDVYLLLQKILASYDNYTWG